MKKLLVIILFFITTSLFAASKKNLDSAYKNIKKNSDNCTNINKEFLNKTTGDKKKFTDFSDLEQKVYIIMNIHTMIHELKEIQEKWQAHMEDLPKTSEDEDEVKKSDLKEYINKLSDMQTQYATKLKELIKDLFKQYPDKFTEEEIEYYLRLSQ